LAGADCERLVRIAGMNRVGDVAAGRNDLFDSIAGLKLEILHQTEQQRIGHRDGEQVLLEPDRDAIALERDLFRDENDGRWIGWVLGEVYVRKSELKRQRLRDLLFRREVHAHEDDA